MTTSRRRARAAKGSFVLALCLAITACQGGNADRASNEPAPLSAEDERLISCATSVQANVQAQLANDSIKLQRELQGLPVNPSGFVDFYGDFIDEAGGAQSPLGRAFISTYSQLKRAGTTPVSTGEVSDEAFRSCATVLELPLPDFVGPRPAPPVPSASPTLLLPVPSGPDTSDAFSDVPELGLGCESVLQAMTERLVKAPEETLDRLVAAYGNAGGATLDAAAEVADDPRLATEPDEVIAQACAGTG